MNIESKQTRKKGKGKKQPLLLFFANASIILSLLIGIFYKDPNGEMTGIDEMIKGFKFILIGMTIGIALTIAALIQKERPFGAYILPIISFIVLFISTILFVFM